MTEKLYYKDAYMREFEAVIEEVREKESGLLVRLDATAFYPEGGGQDADTGILRTESGKELTVIDVQELDGDIWHLVNEEQAKGSVSADEVRPGMKVCGFIDWDRRFDHMQQHSGEHIVSGMICSAFDCDNVGFHMGEDTITIDYNTRISLDEALEIEARANQYIWEDHPFIESWPSADELQNLEYRSKKELSGAVRITSFPGADICACCGTHVSSSAQVGLVKIISAKNFHEGTRLEMYCGKRAADFLSMNYRANKDTAVLLSTSEEKTPERVKHLIDENIHLKTRMSALEGTLLKLMAEHFRGQENVLVIDEDLTPDQGRDLADMIADQNQTRAAVFTRPEADLPSQSGSRADNTVGSGYRYAVIHKGADITSFIREMNAALKGRGGGRNGFAQGSVNATAEEIRRFFS